MARRKAALPSMVLTPRPSLAEFRAAPFRVNALEQDIRYRAQDREDETDADGREPKIPIDCEGEDREPEIREHRHHAEPREHAGVEEERVGPQARQVGGHDDDVQRGDEDDRDGEPQQSRVRVQPCDYHDKPDADPSRHEKKRDQFCPDDLRNGDGYRREVVGRVHVVHPIIEDDPEEADHARIEDRVEADRDLEPIPDEPRREGQQEEWRHEGEEHLRIGPAPLEIEELLPQEGAVPLEPVEPGDDSREFVAGGHTRRFEPLRDQYDGSPDEGGDDSQPEQEERRGSSRVRTEGRQEFVRREAREDPRERNRAGGSRGRKQGGNAGDRDDESPSASHVNRRDEETQRHTEEERQQRGPEEHPDAREPEMRHGDGQGQADRRGDEEQDHVEDRVAQEHAQERPTEPHREDPGHRDQVVARPRRPLEVPSTEESERADAQAVQEDADMQEEDGVRERGIGEQPPARDGDRETEHRDDERERDEHRLTGIARMDAAFLFQHEAKQPAHRHAPTRRMNADSRSASWARIWSTVPVAMIDPLRITATRWHSFAAMSRRWDAMNAVPPPAMYSARNSLSLL